MKYHALLVIYGKAAKFEIVVSWKFMGWCQNGDLSILVNMENNLKSFKLEARFSLSGTPEKISVPPLGPQNIFKLILNIINCI